MQKLKLVSEILIPVFLFTNCGKDQNAVRYNNNEDEICSCEVPIDAYIIYGLILDGLDLSIYQDIILVNDSTKSVESYELEHFQFEKIKERYPALREDTYDNFLELSPQKCKLDSLPPTNKTDVYFYSDYSGLITDPAVYGLISFSCAGFNSDNSQAIIYAQDYRAPLNATAYLSVFEKENNQWIFKFYLLLWIS